MEGNTLRADYDDEIESFMHGDTDQIIQYDTPSPPQSSLKSPNYSGTKRKRRHKKSLSPSSSSHSSPKSSDKKSGKKRKRRVNRSGVWDHFDKFKCPKDKVDKAKCIYCKTAELRADSKSIGTTPLWNHLDTCSHVQAYAKENKIDFKRSKAKGKGVGTSSWKFDQKFSTYKLTRFLILDEMPFSLVEKVAFREFIESTQPSFVFPSRKTATINCYELYIYPTLTLRVSSYKYVMANVVFDELYLVDRLLKYSLQSDDVELNEMSKKMKYDKYFGKAKKMNLILYYAVILDPRHKFESLKFKFERMFPELKELQSNDEETTVPDSLESQSPFLAPNLLEIVQHGFYKMFLEYQKIYRCECVSTPSPIVAEVRFSNEVSNLMELNEEDDFLKARKKAKKGKKRQDKSEMERYLNEDCEEDEEFDILKWWKRESHRFPILSRMARDVLAVPVSTVASESAFSTGGRVLDTFRSSLSPKIGQAIICAQDWMRSDGMPIKVEEDLAQLEKLEQEFTDHDTTLLDS